MYTEVGQFLLDNPGNEINQRCPGKIFLNLEHACAIDQEGPGLPALQMHQHSVSAGSSSAGLSGSVPTRILAGLGFLLQITLLIALQVAWLSQTQDLRAPSCLQGLLPDGQDSCSKDQQIFSTFQGSQTMLSSSWQG